MVEQATQKASAAKVAAMVEQEQEASTAEAVVVVKQAMQEASAAEAVVVVKQAMQKASDRHMGISGQYVMHADASLATVLTLAAMLQRGLPQSAHMTSKLKLTLLLMMIPPVEETSRNEWHMQDAANPSSSIAS